MKRREFLKTAGAGARRDRNRRAGHRPIGAGNQVAHHLELPEVARHALSAAPKCSPRRSPKRPTTSSRSRSSPPARSSRACRPPMRCTNGTVEMCQTASYYYFGKDPTFALRRRSVRPECAPDERVVASRQRRDAVERVLQEVQHHRLPGRQYRRPDGRLVPQGDQDASTTSRASRCGSAGSPAACCRSSACVPQQIAGGEIYPALEKGTIDGAEWVGPYDDEKLGFYKVAQDLLLSGLVGRRHRCSTTSSIIDKWNALPKSYQSILQSASEYRQRLDAGPLRCRKPRRAPASGRGRRATAAVPAAGDGSLLQGVASRSATKPRRRTPISRSSTTSIAAFRNEEYLWWQVAEYSYDSFMIRALRS